MAMVVLPVERSPMINSRWPRPIGIIASIGMMPVCTGTETDFRLMIPGAIFQPGRRWWRRAVPLPSIGSPSVLTTRPSNSRPTGICNKRPVVLTSLAFAHLAAVAEE
jgi:hypothetical protein